MFPRAPSHWSSHLILDSKANIKSIFPTKGLCRLTSIRGPSDCKILMTITNGMQIMEDRAKNQPTPMAQSGYSYTLLYFKGLYFTREKTKQPCRNQTHAAFSSSVAQQYLWSLRHNRPTLISHHAQDRSDYGPAPFHPWVWSVANHILNCIVEIIDSCQTQRHKNMRTHRSKVCQDNEYCNIGYHHFTVLVLLFSVTEQPLQLPMEIRKFMNTLSLLSTINCSRYFNWAMSHYKINRLSFIS